MAGDAIFFIGNISDSLSDTNCKVTIKRDTTVAFSIVNEGSQKSITTLPIGAVHVYEYPANIPVGEVLRQDSEGFNLDSTTNTDDIFLVDLQDGGHYQRKLSERGGFNITLF